MSAHPLAMLKHADLLRLGFSRAQADVMFGALPLFIAPGTTRPRVRASDVEAYVRRYTREAGAIR